MRIEDDIGTSDDAFSTADSLRQIIAPVHTGHQDQVVRACSTYSTYKRLFADALIVVWPCCAGATADIRSIAYNRATIQPTCPRRRMRLIQRLEQHIAVAGVNRGN